MLFTPGHTALFPGWPSLAIRTDFQARMRLQTTSRRTPRTSPYRSASKQVFGPWRLPVPTVDVIRARMSQTTVPRHQSVENLVSVVGELGIG